MKTKTPNAFIYFLTYIIVFPLLKICFHLKVDRKDFNIPKKQPFIILSNHSTMLDFLIAMLSIYPRRLNAVTAQKFFYISPLHKLLPMVGCIPKNLFDPDVRSIIGIKTVLKRGRGVIIFPEGRCSHSQEYAGIHVSTGKLLKKLGVPVVSCYIEGAANCVALWRKGMRLGRMRVTYKPLFTEEDLKQKTIEEINTAIGTRLSGIDGIDPPKKPLETFRAKRLAEGLHKVLYYCPVCKQEFTTTTENNTIRCTACGVEATLNRAGMLKCNSGTVPGFPKSIAEWYAVQMRYEAERLSEDMKPVEINVRLRTPVPKPGGGMQNSGSGILRADPRGWDYEGENNGDPVKLFFPIDTVPALNDDTFNNIQFFHEGNFYVFIPEDIRKIIKYMIIAECLHRKFAKTPLLTLGKDASSSE